MMGEDQLNSAPENTGQSVIPGKLAAVVATLAAWPFVVFILIQPLLPNPGDYFLFDKLQGTTLWASLLSFFLCFGIMCSPRKAALGVVLFLVAMFSGCFSLMAQFHGPDGRRDLREWTQTLFMIRSLEKATQYFRIEYERLPLATNSYDLAMIFNGLKDPITNEDVGKKRPDLLAQNPRRVQFVDLRPRDLKQTSSGGFVLCDPWGTPYSFLIKNGKGGVFYPTPDLAEAKPWPDDKADDGVIVLPFGNHRVIHADCVFFSNGADQRTGTADDIVSWRKYGFYPDRSP